MNVIKEETKSAEATEDKATAPTPADIQPVNAALDTGSNFINVFCAAIFVTLKTLGSFHKSSQ